MEKSLIAAILLGVALASGINANQLTFNEALSINCGCDNNICRGFPNNTAIPNEAGCEHFFICIDEIPVPNTCPPPQWFNPEISQCDNSTNPCNDHFECPPDGIHFFPHDEHCNKFIMCFAGFPIVSRCAEGLYWDRENGKCNFPEYAECKNEVCPPYTDPEQLVFLPSDKKCDKYYICYEGKPWELWCAPGLHWNREIDQCDFPENVNCTIDEPEGPNAPEPHEIDCVNVDGIYFEPHPNSCKHYFICARGVSILLNCAPNFWWDINHNWCDRPENAECIADVYTKLTSPPRVPSLASKPEPIPSGPEGPIPLASIDHHWAFNKPKK